DEFEGEPQVNPHISRDALLSMAGLEQSTEPQAQTQIIEALCLAIPIALNSLFKKGRIHGVVSLGEGSTKAIAADGMRV
ncbi:MAG: hypothetical protein EBV40_02345, partial [Actinobacteria bacterium]|nr:hypothetical protein [Actinomycetota bacterium]